MLWGDHDAGGGDQAGDGRAAAVAAAGSPVRIGPETTARAALLACAHHLPVSRSRDLLAALCGIDVSTGFLAGIRGRAARRLERQFLPHLRALLAGAPGAPVPMRPPPRAAGALSDVHVACTEYLTLMHVGGPPQHRGDHPVPDPGRLRRQTRTDHRSGVRPPRQQHHRQQHVRRPAASAPQAPGNDQHQPVRTTDPTRPGPTPPSQHTRAPRTHPTTPTKPLLDCLHIRLYREHRASERHTALPRISSQEEPREALTYPDPKIVTVAAPTNQVKHDLRSRTQSTRSTAPKRRYVVISAAPNSSYPDQSSTGKRRRAYDQRSTTPSTSSLLGARKIEVKTMLWQCADDYDYPASSSDDAGVMPVGGVFISYRSGDSHSYGALIYSELSRRFGADQVFLDSESTSAGADFVEVLLSRLRQCRVMLVVIGRCWLTATDDAGRRRIDSPEDWVRRELVEAFTHGLRVIPILTEGVEIPAEADLPAGITALHRRQALRMHHRNTSHDLARIVEELIRMDPDLAAVVAGLVVNATPREFRDDVVDLLHRLDVEARTARLPPYLPAGADVVSLARIVRVREGVRTFLSSDGEIDTGKIYLSPVERVHDEQPVRPWREVADEYPCMVVLADPGLGKSWLIRTETHRICEKSLQAMAHGEDVDAVLIPLPVRCDQLIVAAGTDLAQAATSHLVAREQLPERSRVPMQNRIRAGGVVLLMDALDELSALEDRARLKDLLRSWSAQAGQSARYLITSRIADYTGPPLAGAHEVELQAFTDDDVSTAVCAWSMSQALETRLMNRLRDPAIAGMARVPLLLALLCSLAAQLPVGGELPATRYQLYERMLRWFLTRTHRGDDRPELRNTDVDETLEILYPLAFHFATRPEGWVDLMPWRSLVTAIRAAPAFPERHRSAPEIVRELSVEAGVLVAEGDPSQGRNTRYLFLHRTFAEYLVACHVADLPTMDRLTLVNEHLWFEPAWTEVIPLLGGLLNPDEARQLVEYLHDQDTDPFHYALFMAMRVLAERPDLNRLLPSHRQQALTHSLIKVLSHPLLGSPAAQVLASAARLPRDLIQSLLGCLKNSDQTYIRVAALQVLANREEPGLLDTLLPLLDDPDPQIRQLALFALAGQDDPRVLAGLLSRLKDQDPEVRRAVVYVLSVSDRNGRTSIYSTCDYPNGWRKWSVQATAIGREESKVTEAMLPLLEDTDWLVRSLALAALANRSHTLVTQKLLSLLDACDHLERSKIIRALQDRPEAMVTQKLLTLLDNDWIFERDDIIRALTCRLEPRVTERLLGLLQSADTWIGLEVRQEVIDALTASRESAVVDALAALPAADVEYDSAQLAAPVSYPRQVEYLLPLLQADDWQVRQAAFQTLETTDSPEVTETLRLLLTHEAHWVRYAAINALAGREDAVLVDVLLLLARHEEPFTRRMAVEALADRKGPGVIEALLAALQDEDSYVQEAALTAVAGREEPGTVEALLPLLPYQRGIALHEMIEVLTARRDPEALRVLLSLLAHPDSMVRGETITAVSGRSDFKVTEALVPLLDDQDWLVAKSAREAVILRWTNDDSQLLLDRLDHQEQRIRQMAMKALIDREDVDDLTALAQRIQMFRPAALEEVYKAAESLTIRLHLRLSSKDRTQVLTNFDWLTTTMMDTEFTIERLESNPPENQCYTMESGNWSGP